MQNWSLYFGFGVTEKPSFDSPHSSTLQDDVIANYQFQRIGFYWQRVSQSLHIFVDMLYRLTASL